MWRRVFKAASYTPVVVLQGEIGGSSVEARDMRSKIEFVRYLLGSENRVCRRMIESMTRGARGNFWLKMVKEYMERLDLNYEQLREMNRDDVKKRVIGWDSDRWRAEVEGRETLEAYRMKEGIGGV